MVSKAYRYTPDDYIRGIRLLLSCVTPYVAVPINRDSQNYVTINFGNHVPLGVGSGFSLEYQQNYTVDESGVETSGYIYTVFDSRPQQVLNYHWHPGGRSHIVTPAPALQAGSASRPVRGPRRSLTHGLRHPQCIRRVSNPGLFRGASPRRLEISP